MSETSRQPTTENDNEEQRCNRKRGSENKGDETKPKKKGESRRDAARAEREENDCREMSECVCSKRVKHCREAGGGWMFRH